MVAPLLHPFLLLRDREELDRRLDLLERDDGLRFRLDDFALDSVRFRLVDLLAGVRPESLRSLAGEAPWISANASSSSSA